jgi:hypothetical protein
MLSCLNSCPQSMKKIFLLAAVCCVLNSFSQIEEGALASDFSVQDIAGNSRHLYQQLDSGKTVILYCFAAWDSYAWEYHQQQTLESFNALYGSTGSGAVEIWRVECETTNSAQQLSGPASLSGNPSTDTQGDWLAGSEIPVIDDSLFATQLSAPYLPLLIIICPDRLVRFANQLSIGNLSNLVFQSACPPATVGFDPALVSASINRSCGSNEIQLDVVLKNEGTDTLFNTTIQLEGAIASQTVAWQGQLNSYQSDTISISGLQVVTDAPIRCFIEQTNASTQNDTVSVRTDVGYSTRLVRLELALDAYPQEVEWEIQNDSGVVMYNGGGYSIDYQYLNQLFYLPAVGCYSFYLFDSAGDGLHGSQYGGFDGFCKLYSMVDSTTTEEVMLDYDGSYGFSSQPNTPGFLQYNFEAGSPIYVEQEENHTWSVYPNPASDMLRVNLPDVNSNQIVLYDVSGKMIYNRQVSKDRVESIDVSSMPSGVYILSFENGTQTVKHPVIIQH